MKYDDNIERLLLEMKICELKFLRGYDQGKIGKIIGCSRATVSRLLNRAIKDGIIEINIKNPLSKSKELEESLKKKFFLEKAIVVRGKYRDPNILRKAIGTAAQELACNIIQKNDRVGISCGRTVYEMINSLPQFYKKLNIEVVPLLGGFGMNQVHLQTNEMARTFAKNFSGKSKALNVPIVLRNKQACDLLLKEKCVQEIIKIWEKLDIVFVSIGSPASQVYTLATKNITREKGILNQLKIAGDICGRFFDEDGNYIKEIKNYNLIAISFEDLKKIPLRVGIAGGQDKIISIKVALFKKLINILVTDELTAEEILKK